MRVPSGEPELVRAGRRGIPLRSPRCGTPTARASRLLPARPGARRRGGRRRAGCLPARPCGAREPGAHRRELRHGRIARRAHDVLRPAGARPGRGRRAPRPGSSLSAAAARLRPQQRAALALSGLERLPYAEIAAVLGIGAGPSAPSWRGRGCLLRRTARQRPGRRGGARGPSRGRDPAAGRRLRRRARPRPTPGWADPPSSGCPTCPRTRRAMDEAAATYAAWSPALPPSWLRGRPWPSSAPRRRRPGGRGGGRGRGRARRRRVDYAAPERLRRPARRRPARPGVRRHGPDRERVAAPARPSDGVRLPDAVKSLRVARCPPPPAKGHAPARQRRAPRGRKPRPARTGSPSSPSARSTARRRLRCRVSRQALPPPRLDSLPRARRQAGRPRRRHLPLRPSRRPHLLAPAPVTADAPADESPGTELQRFPRPRRRSRRRPRRPRRRLRRRRSQRRSDDERRDRWSDASRDQDHGGGWHEGRRRARRPARRCHGWSCRH